MTSSEWATLVAIVLTAGTLLVQYLNWRLPIAPRSGTGNADRYPRLLWSWGGWRNARYVTCLACGKSLLASISIGEAGRWRCRGCDRESIAAVATDGKVTISTPQHGTIRLTQRVRLLGFVVQTYRVEILKPSVREHRDEFAEVNRVGQTSFARSVSGMYEFDFRAAFVGGLLRERARYAIGAGLVGAYAGVSVEAWSSQAFDLGTVFAALLGFLVATSILLAGISWRALRTFDQWCNSRNSRFCYLQRPNGVAFAMVMEHDAQWAVELLKVRGRRTRGLAEELMSDLCRYADRSGFTLHIIVRHPHWLTDELGFKRDEVQPKRRHRLVSLHRTPSRTRRIK